MNIVKQLALCLVLMSVSLLLVSCRQPAPADNAADWHWHLPEGMPLPRLPPENPMSQAKVTLGRYLFYDTQLSANGSQSCASCHQQQFAFAEPRTRSVGSTGQQHRRNALALVNVAYNNTLTWAHDGLTEIEQQLLIPLFSDDPVELGLNGNQAEILQRLTRPPYPQLFQQAFASPEPQMQQVVLALASFVRSLLSFQSDFDRYAYQQDDAALTDVQLEGMNLFFSERLECHHCHGGFNFTQATSHSSQPLDLRPFHNTGLYFTARPELATPGYPQQDRGLAEISMNPADDGRFRAPTLRNIALTAPYMHDGSIATLEQVVDFYAAGGRFIDKGEYAGDGRQHPIKSQFVQGFALSPSERAAVLAFLHSLTDWHFVTDPDHSDPWPVLQQPDSLPQP
ncbi:cytochrome C peroxidase [Arsukibacterium ikkense]|uniref:Cytochrome C peroxidase n=1 Tax=Arsukibacterium ikkense TaxID=336831 RepID=A0A0M2V9P6_9GAMM|nr:MbnH family di-heme enzyme [Arsukibacterium ikkense]KKO47149.1 cytochrome C peroxidase [Arsukibacterium ikkense]